MKFLADECVDGMVVDALRSDGHEVIYVVEFDRSMSDDEIIQRANVENAILITEDKDFGELVFRLGRITCGVVLLRLHGLDASQKANIVVNAIKNHQTELAIHFSVVSASSIRIRKPPQ